MNPGEIVDALRTELQEKHYCHTVILYGSRASGAASAGSDYDLAGFAAVGTTRREARVWRSAFVDLFIYPESYLTDPVDLLKLRRGVVLVERDGQGTALLARLEKQFAAGPEKLPPDELEARGVWAKKMLERAQRGDLEGDYRRVWLLTALLEDYFHLRGLWFLGPKTALAWLREHDPATCAGFETALKPGARLESLTALVALVVDSIPH